MHVSSMWILKLTVAARDLKHISDQVCAPSAPPRCWDGAPTERGCSSLLPPLTPPAPRSSLPAHSSQSPFTVQLQCHLQGEHQHPQLLNRLFKAKNRKQLRRAPQEDRTGVEHYTATSRWHDGLTRQQTHSSHASSGLRHIPGGGVKWRGRKGPDQPEALLRK